jgi:general secretion pathway protein G
MMKNRGFTQLEISRRDRPFLTGFTLIEIMVVLIIIGILASLILAGVFGAMENARKSRAEADIATLETAISMYNADIGSYPAGGGSGNSFKAWLQENDGSTGWNGPYMHFKAENLSGNSFEDPWGAAYNYTSPGTNNSGFVDIEDGSSKGINNW